MCFERETENLVATQEQNSEGTSCQADETGLTADQGECHSCLNL